MGQKRQYNYHIKPSSWQLAAASLEESKLFTFPISFFVYNDIVSLGLYRTLQQCKFCEEPTSDQLAKYFILDDQDKLLVFRRKGEHNHLGFALQLGTVRFSGAFLTNPIDVPSNVIHYLSSQLNISDSVLALYQASKTHWSHKLEIKETYGYHDFTEQPYHLRLIHWLYNHFWLSSEHPGVLFNLALE